MNRKIRVVGLVAPTLLLLSTNAHASGGWEGLGLLLVAVLVPVFLVLLVALGLSFKYAKGAASRIAVGIVGLVLGIPVAVLQVALIVSTFLGMHRTYDPYASRQVWHFPSVGGVVGEIVFDLVAIGIAAVTVYLAGRLLKSGRAIRANQDASPAAPSA